MADQSGVTPVTKPSDETPCASKDASDPVIASERLDQDTGTGIQDRAPRVWNTGALPAPEDAQKAEGGVREPLSAERYSPPGGFVAFAQRLRAQHHWRPSGLGCSCGRSRCTTLLLLDRIDMPAPADANDRPQRCPATVPEGNVVTEGRQCQQYEGHTHGHTWYGDSGVAYSYWVSRVPAVQPAEGGQS